jgi:hypothetical protein
MYLKKLLRPELAEAILRYEDTFTLASPGDEEGTVAICPKCASLGTVSTELFCSYEHTIYFDKTTHLHVCMVV